MHTIFLQLKLQVLTTFLLAVYCEARTPCATYVTMFMCLAGQSKSALYKETENSATDPVKLQSF